MDTPPLRKGTAADVNLSYQLGMDGGLLLLVVIRQRFAVAKNGEVAPADGATVCMADELWNPDEPETSSIKLPSDLCVSKPGTDILVVGEAMQRDRAPTSQLDVYIRVGTIEKTLRVFGTRVWYPGVGGAYVLSKPEPFESMPLRWEYAYGGRDADTDPPLEEPRNPVGRGVVRDSKKLKHTPGPNLEDPRNLIKDHKSRPSPVCTAALGRHFEPRRRYAGTMDEIWKRERMPLPPMDFDDRFNQLAPPDLISHGHLRGGEQVDLLGLSPWGAMRFFLPRTSYYVGAETEDGMTEHRVVLDTVILQPNDASFDLVYRTHMKVPKPVEKLRGVQVHERRRL